MDDELGLKFDTMEENTDLAKDYISANNGEFNPIGCNPSKYKFVVDNANNKLYDEDPKQKGSLFRETPVQPIDSTVFEKLAHKIEENAELFAQLEVLIRKKRKQEVKKWDIHLIVQNLLYSSVRKCNPDDEMPKMLMMYSATPLADLGHIASILAIQRVIIVASANTGVVSHLFTKLCHEVGLTSVSLTYTSDGPRITNPVQASLETHGCVGVITAHADTDSALDTLLTSTTQYPWKVQRILIQESINETVIKTLKWKCNLKPTDRTVDAKFKQSCIDAKFYEDKLLLFDYTGNYKDITQEDLNLNIVYVGAYRTSKELMSLLNQYEPLCLSLWSSDNAESDEIAFSVKTPIVWINEFGSFWGSTDASEAYYSSVYTGIHTLMGSNVEKLLKLRDAWRKIDIRSRKAILKDVVNSCEDYENNKEKVFKLISDQRWRDTEKFVEIQNNRICIGRKDRDELFRPSGINVEDIFGFLIAGGAVRLEWIDDPFKDWLEALTKKGVPIFYTYYCDGVVETGGTKYNWTARANTKVVYRSFGTIFAN